MYRPVLSLAAFNALQMKKRDNLNSINALVIHLVYIPGIKDAKSAFKVDSTAIVPFNDQTIARYSLKSHHDVYSKKLNSPLALVLLESNTTYNMVPIGFFEEPDDDPNWELALRIRVNQLEIAL